MNDNDKTPFDELVKAAESPEEIEVLSEFLERSLNGDRHSYHYMMALLCKATWFKVAAAPGEIESTLNKSKDELEGDLNTVHYALERMISKITDYHHKMTSEASEITKFQREVWHLQKNATEDIKSLKTELENTLWKAEELIKTDDFKKAMTAHFRAEVLSPIKKASSTLESMLSVYRDIMSEMVSFKNSQLWRWSVVSLCVGAITALIIKAVLF